MKLELTIADDKELRAFIKDQIKGMVLSVARDEIVEVVSKAASEKGVNDKDFLSSIINELIYTHFGGRHSFSNKVRDIIREEVRAVIKEMIKSGNIKALL